jgi:hypothetical protein
MELLTHGGLFGSEDFLVWDSLAMDQVSLITKIAGSG